MSDDCKTYRDREVAVFTRNHKCYLEEAMEIAEKYPRKSITFRAATRWTSAAKHLKTRSPLELYIAAIGSEGLVEFVADLHQIHLDLSDEARTKELLKDVLTSTAGEGMWSDGRTLYALRNCRKLSRPFSMTELVKVSDKKRLSEDYSYSYSVVYGHKYR
jgi:hypothetical protein